MKCLFNFKKERKFLEMNHEFKGKKCLGVPILGVLSLIGGIFVMLALGSFYSFGNIMTYMTSYMRQHSQPNLTYSDFVVVQSTFGITIGVTMPLMGYVTLQIGEKSSILLGGALYSLGCALTYFTIQRELWMVAATYGLVSSVGQNLALIPTITTAIKWFPEHKGLVAGVIVSGYGGGSFIFNQIQTKYINPENFLIESSGSNKGYFTNPILLDRLPQLLLLLGGIYFLMSFIGGLLIFQPSEEWVGDTDKIRSDNPDAGTWKDIFKRKELYILWITRFSLTLCTLVVSGFYKTFGLTFIFDDHFLSLVGTICSLFNCAGRIFYGFLMDKLTYKVAMSIEAIVLVVLTSTLYCSSLLVYPSEIDCASYMEIDISDTTFVEINKLCEPSPESELIAKVLFSVWIWAIYFTFPGTYAMQPAVCTQTFGQKYGGMAYSFLFTSDIFNNLLVATLSKPLIEATGFLGLFLSTSIFSFLALILTLFYPKYPNQNKNTPTDSSV